MKTPGVYIVEKNAFPNSVVEVATAVPAFIGYTQIASNKGKPLTNIPWRITSFAEYVSYFGGAPTTMFEFRKRTSTDMLPAVVKRDDGGQFIVTPASTPVPDKDKEKAAETAAKKVATARKAVDDAKTALAATPGDAELTKALEEKQEALATAEQDSAKAAAAAFLSTAFTGDKRYRFYHSMRLFFQNGGGPCYIVSVGDYESDIAADKMMAGIKTLTKEQEPTMVLFPDAVSLNQADCNSVHQAALTHCGEKMKNRFAVLDVWGGERDRADPRGDFINLFRNQLGKNFLNFAAAYYPWVETTIVQDGDVTFDNLNDGQKKFLQVQLVTEQGLSDQWDAQGGKFKEVKVEDTDTPEIKATKQKAIELIEIVSGLTESFTGDNAETEREAIHKNLYGISSVYKETIDSIRDQLNVLPPASAMAGIYTMVDNSRGVWKAPANVSLNSVIRPTVNITHDDQMDLNVTSQGKSINAIRSFIGEGVLVWGARTLDGNSLDWRYINVRRTMIMLEESIKLAAKAYVFEPNVGNTWVTIRSMIRNFLTGIWKRGGLAGAVPEDAFSVHVGLGETMTPEDILEGILRVTVLVAVSRPAEFIEITFQQQMQKS
jgi:phage tail sheath protein FI